MKHSELLDLLNYDPETGVFVWKVTRGRLAKEGQEAGYLHHSGYLHMTVRGKYFAAHRLAWFYVFGSWPVGEIDHKNGVRTDNRIDNLRDVARTINMHNQARAHSRNKTGLLGATWFAPQQKYRARIRLNGKLHELGYFKTAEAAHEAYLVAKRELHPLAIRVRSPLDKVTPV